MTPPAGTSWEAGPENVSLDDDEVHVWCAPLDVTESHIQRLREILMPDECAKADRFFFERDRNRFVAGRGMLRIVLGKYLNREPAEVRFTYNNFGKPALAEEPGGTSICFNLSHSGGLALLAVTRDREVGIDLEWIRPGVAELDIARRFFSPREVSELLQVPEYLQQRAFFQCWTRKEAYIKAKGMGLSLSLDGFDVSVTPGEPPALLATRHDPPEYARWRMNELIPDPDYVAAVAVAGDSWRLKCWHWQGLPVERNVEA